MSETKQISNINTLRGFAALSVCMFHTAGTGSLHSAGLLDKFSFLFQYGYLGVQVFFVISGFIIPYSMYKSNYNIKTFHKFILKRYIRIAPTAWVSIAIMMAFYWLPVLLFNKYISVTNPADFSLHNIPANLLFLAPFLQSNWIISILWTLNIEFQFYLFIGFFFPLLMGKKGVLYFIIVFFSLSGLFYKLIAGYNYNGEVVFATYIFYHAPLFCIGIVTFLYKIKKISVFEYIYGMLLFFVIGLFTMNHINEIIAGLLSALFILFIHYSNPVSDFFGNISYSLYLNHLVFIVYIDAIFRQIFPRTNNILANLFLITVFYLIIFLGSWFFYNIVERYFHKLAQKIK